MSLTLTEAIEDRQILGSLPHFQDLAPWRTWFVVWRAVYGLPLSEAEQETFCALTGRSRYAPPEGGYRFVTLCVGRRAGKTTAAATLATFEAISAGRDARGQYVVCVAQDHRAAVRNLFAQIARPFETVPMLSALVKARTVDTLTLTSGIVCATFPCKPSALRGFAARLVCIDEIAFAASPDGRPVDRELLTAARPLVATTNGRIVVLSSPSYANGALYDLVRAHWGRDDSSILVIKASAPLLNPTLPADYLEAMALEDPEAYRSEVLGEFRSGACSLFDPNALDRCIVEGRGELPPVEGVNYRAFVDPAAGGKGGDRFALCIGHRDGRRIVLDALRSWPAPFNPSGVVSEIVETCRRYSVKQVVGDRYGGELIASLFKAEGMSYGTADQGASDLALDALAVVQSGGVELMDPACNREAGELVKELRALERRPGGGGRDRVEAPRGSGHSGHCDTAFAACGLMSLLPDKRRRRSLGMDLDTANRSTRPTPLAALLSDMNEGNLIAGILPRYPRG